MPNLNIIVTYAKSDFEILSPLNVNYKYLKLQDDRAYFIEMNNIDPEISFGDFTDRVSSTLDRIPDPSYNYSMINLGIDYKLCNWSYNNKILQQTPVCNFKHIRNKILEYSGEGLFLSDLKEIKDKKNKSFYPLKLLLNTKYLGKNINSSIVLKLCNERLILPIDRRSKITHLNPENHTTHKFNGNEEKHKTLRNTSSKFNHQKNTRLLPGPPLMLRSGEIHPSPYYAEHTKKIAVKRQIVDVLYNLKVKFDSREKKMIFCDYRDGINHKEIKKKSIKQIAATAKNKINLNSQITKKRQKLIWQAVARKCKERKVRKEIDITGR